MSAARDCVQRTYTDKFARAITQYYIQKAEARVSAHNQTNHMDFRAAQ